MQNAVLLQYYYLTGSGFVVHTQIHAGEPLRAVVFLAACFDDELSATG